MKKLFIGLLITAAGAGAYFLLAKKDKPVRVDNFSEELIIGKWKLDSIHFFSTADSSLVADMMPLVNSNLKKYYYDFAKDGAVAFSVGDSVIKDSTRYEWDKERQLVWKRNSADSAGDIFNVSLLNKDSLTLQSKDSAILLFTKVK